VQGVSLGFLAVVLLLLSAGSLPFFHTSLAVVAIAAVRPQSRKPDFLPLG
jgi:hypothetical protein